MVHIQKDMHHIQTAVRKQAKNIKLNLEFEFNKMDWKDYESITKYIYEELGRELE